MQWLPNFPQRCIDLKLQHENITFFSTTTLPLEGAPSRQNLFCISCKFIPSKHLSATHRYTPKKQRSKNLHHLEPGVSRNQNNQINKLSQVHVLPACTAVWAWKQTSAKCCTAREDRERISLRLFLCVWSAKTPPPLSPKPKGDYAITWGGIGGLGSLVHICGAIPGLHYLTRWDEIVK